jgi:hypothetical protein
MRKKQQNCRNLIYFLICLALVFAVACAREEKFLGTYKPTQDNPPEFTDVIVELRRGGIGIRRVRGEEVTFEWEVKGNQIRIQTKAGGIIVAEMRHGLLEVSLPGPRTIYLEKID